MMIMIVEKSLRIGEKRRKVWITLDGTICLSFESQLRLKSFLREVLASILSGIIIFLECCFSFSVNIDGT